MEEALRRLPGMKPLEPSDWLRVDDAFAGQMARRDALLIECPEAVLQLDAAARPAADELLKAILTDLRGRADYQFDGARVKRPDSVEISLSGDPLFVIGRLCQADFCILEKRGAEHVLTGAVLCFPASWTLSEKFMRPLTAIHDPVPEYSEDIARRVQRLFDAVRVGRPMWRANALFYSDPELHQPRRMSDRRVKPEGAAPYIRSERQSILRLPKTEAVIFSIHTYVLAQEDLSPAQTKALDESPLIHAGR